MRTLFLNATTADGYNPYRITSDGIDWELPDPEDPWSNIGYWGDHQIIYLLRLLETEEHYFPGNLALALNDRVHSYANVPYEIQGYDTISQNPRSTIHFNKELNDRLQKKYEAIGADGKLVSDNNGEVLLVTLSEKLLIPLLTKLSNLIPGGGIWLKHTATGMERCQQCTRWIWPFDGDSLLYSSISALYTKAYISIY